MIHLFPLFLGNGDRTAKKEQKQGIIKQKICWKYIAAEPACKVNRRGFFHKGESPSLSQRYRV